LVGITAQQVDVLATQAPLHSLKPELQVNPQALPSQVAVPLVDGDGQTVQEVPHAVTLVFDLQVPPQLCMPAGQTMPQVDVLATQAPLHSLKPVLQVNPQALPSQVAVPLVGGDGQTVQEAPHAVTLVFDLQVPPQLCMPAGQTTPHVTLLATQTPLHSLKPVLQAKLQEPPLQVAEAFCGTGHAVHEVPQPLTLVFDRHTPAQLCMPAGQVMVHVDDERMQTPLQSLKPVAQTPPQRPLVQVAAPLAGAGQAVQETPQCAGELLETHTLPQR